VNTEHCTLHSKLPDILVLQNGQNLEGSRSISQQFCEYSTLDFK
jgi:hypothetical protein